MTERGPQITWKEALLNTLNYSPKKNGGSKHKVNWTKCLNISFVNHVFHVLHSLVYWTKYIVSKYVTQKVSVSQNTSFCCFNIILNVRGLYR